jgi:ribosomal-protein-alanine N-acetyltransferase
MSFELRFLPHDRAIADVLADIVPPLEAESVAMLAEGLEAMRAEMRDYPWGNFLAWRDGVAVGCCGFKNIPGPGDPPEIGYMTFPRAEASGVATAMAGALVAIATAAGEPLVIAHTLPVTNASARALARNGFIRDGDAIDPDEGPVWRWARQQA